MLDKADRIFIGVATVFALTGFAAIGLSSLEGKNRFPAPDGPRPRVVAAANTQATSPQAWFASVRPYCNPVDVETRLRFSPPPATESGTMEKAACYALAGKIDQARASLMELPANERWRGAGVVFNAGHPAADAGDELAAGPLMELVVEFWPNHYMALYHAGAAAFERGEHDAAKGYLERFLVEYEPDDGWTASASSMLEEIG